ncbi:hypothetical protein Bca4012_049616 [Brassica carinata]
MSSSEIRAQKNQLPSLISSLPEEIFVDIVAPCLSILLPESLPSLHVFPITHGEEREKTLSDIAKACEEWGFFQLVSHGTPLELLNKVKDLGSDCYKYRERRSVQDFNTLAIQHFWPQRDNVGIHRRSDEASEQDNGSDGLESGHFQWGLWLSFCTSYYFWFQILTLQASNLTSEDLSLTVLAPTSFTSPISPFLRFFEFTERVQTENAIQQRRSISNESSRRQSLGGADIILKLNGFFTTYYPSEATRATVS